MISRKQFVLFVTDYPSLWFQKPYFHPLRPRYYKDSMFGAFLSYTVAIGLHEYMKKNNLTSKNGEKNHFDLIQVLFENYASWDSETKEDKYMPAFLFSNQQMFWFTLIHKNCVKLQPGKTALNTRQFDYNEFFRLHVRL